MDLQELLVTRRDVVLHRWTDSVLGTVHPETMPAPVLIDHLPRFLETLARAVQRNSLPQEIPTAADHGLQRFQLGFDLGSVVREYGALLDAIVETAAAEGVVIVPSDHQVLVHCVVTGIADAVSEFTRQRDAQLQRQANEHFAFVAHELRNPLGAGLAALGLLKRTTRVAEERAGHALERALTRMHDLVENTLRITRISSGIEARLEPVTLSELLNDAELAALPSAEEKEVRLAMRCESETMVHVDVRLVRSALTNLVRNAVKYTSPGGAVEVRAHRSLDRVVIEVEDSCGGLPPGAVEKAFAPFAQMGADRSGFGLGLAIAKQAVDAHGGSIRVQNLPGKGCIFALELPVSGGPRVAGADEGRSP
jgi:signal transduction histidine kinase